MNWYLIYHTWADLRQSLDFKEDEQFRKVNATVSLEFVRLISGEGGIPYGCIYRLDTDEFLGLIYHCSILKLEKVGA